MFHVASNFTKFHGLADESKYNVKSKLFVIQENRNVQHYLKTITGKKFLTFIRETSLLLSQIREEIKKDLYKKCPSK